MATRPCCQLSAPRAEGANWPRAILQRCTDAARTRHQEVVAYRFPSEVCSDGGRVINNDDPDWPASLTGQPWAVYEYWQSVLRPACYRFKARILDYPRGMPGMPA